MAETALLELDGVQAWYGASHVLHGISLRVNAGEVVALVGRNGAGKTTTLRTIMGLMLRAAGQVRFAGVDLLPLAAHRRFHLGLAYVPEERRIVPGLSVRENLRLGLVAAKADIEERAAFAEIAETFPRLRERLDQEGVTLSGGEQKMLIVARALMAKPDVLLLDEVTEGLQPSVVDRLSEVLVRVRREIGTSMIVVEQHLPFALSISDRYLVFKRGEIVDA
ncbi:MAG: ABC transporter ATP-binding protein, partial [Bradyrhizobium sp.]|nr:ABC transporter ATP-binding protein [Bradyrhizobium sp.]